VYEHLNLKAWPFQTVPDEEFAAVWAGRPETKEQLKRLLWKMQFAPKSGLHLLWANFGMGKTHTLLHLQHLCHKTSGRLVPVYAVMPRRSYGFLDLYRVIVSELPLRFLGEQLVKVGSGYPDSLTLHPMFRRSPGIVNAILSIRSGEAERAMAGRQWLMGQPGLTLRDLRMVGVTYRVKTPEDALNALEALTRLITYDPNSPRKLVLMLDEFQRVGELTPRIMNEVNAGLHSYFNTQPTGLDLVLSFSFGRKENVEYLLSGELKSRAEPESITLDVLDREEAVEFIGDLLEEFRLHPDEQWAYPFSPKAVNVLVTEIAERKALTPRRLMLYANHVVMESQLAHGPGYTGVIKPKEVRTLVNDDRLGALDIDGPESG